MGDQDNYPWSSNTNVEDICNRQDEGLNQIVTSILSEKTKNAFAQRQKLNENQETWRAVGSGSLPSNNNLNSLNDFRPGNALKSVRNLSRFNVPDSTLSGCGDFFTNTKTASLNDNRNQHDTLNSKHTDKVCFENDGNFYNFSDCYKQSSNNSYFHSTPQNLSNERLRNNASPNARETNNKQQDLQKKFHQLGLSSLNQPGTTSSHGLNFSNINLQCLDPLKQQTTPQKLLNRVELENYIPSPIETLCGFREDSHFSPAVNNEDQCFFSNSVNQSAEKQNELIWKPNQRTGESKTSSFDIIPPKQKNEYSQFNYNAENIFSNNHTSNNTRESRNRQQNSQQSSNFQISANRVINKRNGQQQLNNIYNSAAGSNMQTPFFQPPPQLQHFPSTFNPAPATFFQLDHHPQTRFFSAADATGSAQYLYNSSAGFQTHGSGNANIRQRFPIITSQGPPQAMYPPFVNENIWPIVPIPGNQTQSTQIGTIPELYGVPSAMFAVRPLIRNPNPHHQQTGNLSKNMPSTKLYQAIEESYDEYKNLEKERKKAETELGKAFPGRRVSSSMNTPLPRPPANPSRVDKLITDQHREHGRVMALIDRMAHLLEGPMHATVNTLLEEHYQRIREVEAKRRDEMSSRQSSLPGSPMVPTDNDIERLMVALAEALKNLTKSTKRSRTALWAALQITLDSKTAKQQEADSAMMSENN